MEGQQPGQTISPHSKGEQQHASEPRHPAKPASPAAQPATPKATSEPPAQWKFLGGGAVSNAAPTTKSQSDKANPAPAAGSVSWTASEFIEHSKNAGWYIKLAGAAIVLAALVFIVTRDKISTSVVIVAAVALGVFAARKPHVLQYRLDNNGLTVGPKLYSYEQFKSFSIVDEGAVPSIYLLPMKRFMPALTLYYAPADEDVIVDVLLERLPIEERRSDTVDRFMHRIRF